MVLERANVIGQVCVLLFFNIAYIYFLQHHGACNLPSNVTKIFAQWGITSDDLDSFASKPLGLEYLMCKSPK